MAASRRIVRQPESTASVVGAMMKGGLLETIRQGDVLLIPIAPRDPANVGRTRKGGNAVRREDMPEVGKVIVLAHGEATGHHHHVKSRGAVMRRYGRRRILHVGHEGAALEHQEHSPIALAPGRYEVVRQTEYTPPVVERTVSVTPQQRESWRTNVYD